MDRSIRKIVKTDSGEAIFVTEAFIRSLGYT